MQVHPNFMTQKLGYYDNTRAMGRIIKNEAGKLRASSGILNLPEGSRCVTLRLAAFKVKVIAKIAAMALALVVTAFAETLYSPARRLVMNEVNAKHEKLQRQLTHDVIESLTPAKKAQVIQEIHKFAAAEGLDVSPHAANIALATYASSQRYYGPIVLEMVKGLMDTALAEDRKLVFLARDGLAPFLVANKLKEKYPEKYGEIETSYVYVSRKVVKSSAANKEHPTILQDYMTQSVELGGAGLKKGDKCVFVDIGFAGSMIKPVKEQLKDLELDVVFQFLVSHTKNAKGFLGDMETELASIDHMGAGGNAAVHWLEDTHQGSIVSPTKLMVGTTKDGKPVIAPDNHCKGGKYNPEDPVTCKEKRPFDYLLQKFGLQGVLEYMDREDADTTPSAKPVAWKKCDEKMRKVFDDFLKSYRYGDRYKFVDDPDTLKI